MNLSFVVLHGLRYLFFVYFQNENKVSILCFFP